LRLCRRRNFYARRRKLLLQSRSEKGMRSELFEAPIGCKVGRYGRVEPPRGSRGAISQRAGDFGTAALRRAAGSHDDIMPGAVGAELKTGTSDAASRKFVGRFL